MTSQFADLTSSLIFFWHSRISLVKFSYWSKFNFNIMTSSEVMTIFIYEFCPIIGDWDKLGIPNFAVMSLIAAITVSGYWWKTNRRGKITPPPPPPTPSPPTKIRVKDCTRYKTTSEEVNEMTMNEMFFRPNEITVIHAVKMKSLKPILVTIFFQFLLEMVYLIPLRLFWSLKTFNESVWKTFTLWLGKFSEGKDWIEIRN